MRRKFHFGALLFAMGMVLAGSLAAHPTFFDRWSINVETNGLEALYTANLHEVAVTQGLGTNKITGEALAVWINAVSNHASYLSTNLSVVVDGRRRPWQVAEFQIKSGSSAANGEAAELEDTRALIYFEAELPAQGGKLAVFSQSVLQGYNYAPGIPWSVQVQTVVRRAGAELLGDTVLLKGQDWPVPLGEGGLPGAKTAQSSRFRAFVVAGLFHVWEGWDHLLFLLGLVLAVRTLRELSLLILIFTGAHSLTISLSAFGLVHVSPAIVEPGIAASIIAVALMNLVSLRWPMAGNRYAAAGAFGLLHGLGFASGLLGSTGGASGKSLAVMVAAFCIGVELAHGVVGLPAFLLLRRFGGGKKDGPPRHWLQWGSWLAATGGLVMLIQAAREYW